MACMIKDFIFTPGLWLGEGKISFTISPEFIKFYTKWEIVEDISGITTATQIVEMQEMEERVINHFTFKDIQPTSFTVILENELVGSVTGKGIRDERTIAWEFRNQPNFEGFEVYEQQENGDYFLHAEYGSPDHFRTIVEGLVWRKGS
jgi:hypothetical protein